MSFPDLDCGIGLNIHTNVRRYNEGLTVNERMYNWVDSWYISDSDSLSYLFYGILILCNPSYKLLK